MAAAGELIAQRDEALRGMSAATRVLEAVKGAACAAKTSAVGRAELQAQLADIAGMGEVGFWNRKARQPPQTVIKI